MPPRPEVLTIPQTHLEKFREALRHGVLLGVDEKTERHSGVLGIFDEHPHKGLQEGVSGHGVFFGRLSGRFGNDMVAVKAHGTMKDAEAELAGRHIVSELGYATYDPYGIVQGKEGETFLLTRFNPELLSLNELPWPPVASGLEDEQYQRQAELIGGCAESLAALHIQGRATHGDAQIKNFAIHHSRPGVHPIDYENVERCLDPLERAARATDDLVKLRDSLCVKPLATMVTLTTAWECGAVSTRRR